MFVLRRVITGLSKSPSFTPHLASSVAMIRSESTRAMKSHLVWIDMEMTGLDHLKDNIMEVACIVTDQVSYFENFFIQQFDIVTYFDCRI